MALYGESPSPSKGGEEAGMQGYKAAGGGTAAGTGKVYMGTTKPVRAEGIGYYSEPIVATKQEAYAVIDNYSGKQLRDFINAGIVAGKLQDDAGYIEAAAFWKKLVDASASLTAAGRKVSPTDVLSGYLGKGPLATGQPGAAGESLWQTQYRGGRKFLVNSQTGEVKYQGPRFETTYNKAIDLTDPTTAKAIATTVFQQLMHRDPGKGEMAGFADALRNAEQQSPVVTNTTVEYDMNTGEAIGQSSTSSGGMGADAKQYLAEQRIKGTKEYGAVQAATTYSNALENAVFNNPFGSL